MFITLPKIMAPHDTCRHDYFPVTVHFQYQYLEVNPHHDRRSLWRVYPLGDCFPDHFCPVLALDPLWNKRSVPNCSYRLTAIPDRVPHIPCPVFQSTEMISTTNQVSSTTLPQSPPKQEYRLRKPPIPESTTVLETHTLPQKIQGLDQHRNGSSRQTDY